MIYAISIEFETVGHMYLFIVAISLGLYIELSVYFGFTNFSFNNLGKS